MFLISVNGEEFSIGPVSIKRKKRRLVTLFVLIVFGEIDLIAYRFLGDVLSGEPSVALQFIEELIRASIAGAGGRSGVLGTWAEAAAAGAGIWGNWVR